MALPGEEHHRVEVNKIGKLDVYLQGSKHPEVSVLTVHDLGCNHDVFHKMAEHEAFEEITKRVQWVHIDIPGQQNNSEDLPADYQFPSMQELGEALDQVLDHLNISSVVCLGEGAGANILARFAMKNDQRVLALVLIHCTGTTAGFMETMKDKIITYKLTHQGHNAAAVHYLETHRFGTEGSSNNKEQVNKVMDEFKKSLETNINPRNLRMFVDSFLRRTQLVSQASLIRCPVLLVTGEKASHNHTVRTFHQALRDKSKVELVEVPGVANVIVEAPQKFAVSFQYFLQGVGKVGHVKMANVNREGMRGRSMSMEEADLPRGADSLIHSPSRKYSCSATPPAE